MEEKNMSKVQVMDHPLIQHKVNYIRRKEKIGSVWMKAVMMLLCPVIGPAFVFLSFLLFKLFSSQGMDLSDVVFSKDRKENFLRPDEEMERNMVSLEEALEVTDKKNLRTLMLNVIRGDYRNSLAAINLALNSEDSETAHYAASVLQDVLNDFRSKVQTDYLLCQEENEQQVENCIKLVEYMNPILEQNQITHRVHRKNIQHTALKGSPLQLRQIMLNLFSNAVKYNKPQGSVDTDVEELSCDGKTAWYEFRIADTGIGMSGDFVKNQLFEPFTQEQYGARTRYQGTGLGMSIVKGLVEKMGGTIQVESVRGEGTTFTVKIPLSYIPS